MISIQEELSQVQLNDEVLEIDSPTDPQYNVEGPSNCNANGKISWIDGFFGFGCLKPVLSMMGKNIPTKQTEDLKWEIPFEMISDLEWLGSGAQG